MLGSPKFKLWKSFRNTRRLSCRRLKSAQTIYNDIDKTMLARLGTLKRLVFTVLPIGRLT
jgi:hypothetical protein